MTTEPSIEACREAIQAYARAAGGKMAEAAFAGFDCRKLVLEDIVSQLPPADLEFCGSWPAEIHCEARHDPSEYALDRWRELNRATKLHLPIGHKLSGWPGKSTSLRVSLVRISWSAIAPPPDFFLLVDDRETKRTALVSVLWSVLSPPIYLVWAAEPGERQ